MMPTLTFDLCATSGTTRADIAVHDLVVAGWTGRDPHELEKHIAELAAVGVARPATTPCFYRAGIEMLTTASEIDCLGAESSGEAEYVLVIDADGEWWIGAGSDHTDRKVEGYSIAVSKQMCPKPIAPMLWRFADIADHWDALQIRSWVDEDATRTLYQDGAVSGMLHPRDTVAAYLGQGHTLEPGTIMMGGTLPAIGGIRARKTFAFELRDPIMDRVIAHSYMARWLPVVR